MWSCRLTPSLEAHHTTLLKFCNQFMGMGPFSSLFSLLFWAILFFQLQIPNLDFLLYRFSRVFPSPFQSKAMWCRCFLLLLFFLFAISQGWRLLDTSGGWSHRVWWAQITFSLWIFLFYMRLDWDTKIAENFYFWSEISVDAKVLVYAEAKQVYISPYFLAKLMSFSLSILVDLCKSKI